MSSDTGFTIEGWAEFVENFSKLVDKWAEKKSNSLISWVCYINPRL